MGKRDPEFILDKLRTDLGYTAPELQDLRWDVAKREISHLIRKSGPKPVKLAAVCLVAGGGLGIFAIKALPNTPVMRYLRFLKEVYKARDRINTIANTKPEDVQDAIQDEQNFLNVMGQEVGSEVEFHIGPGGKIGRPKINNIKKKERNGTETDS